MKLGVNLWTIYGREPTTWLSSRVLERLAEAGAQGIELVLDESHYTVDRWLARSTELLPVLQDVGVTVPSVASTLSFKYNLASQSPSVRGQALRVIRDECQVACQYNASVIQVVPGFQELNTNYKTTYEIAVQTLRQAARYAEQYGVTIAVENVPADFLQSPLELSSLVRDVNSPHVQIYLSIGNVLAAGQTFPENWISVLGGQLVQVHASDYAEASPSPNRFRPCGEGTIDWKGTFNALERQNFNGFLIIDTPPGSSKTRSLNLHAAETGLEHLAQFL
jgi:hexulose-6-phosphate isomerase